MLSIITKQINYKKHTQKKMKQPELSGPGRYFYGSSSLTTRKWAKC